MSDYEDFNMSIKSGMVFYSYYPDSPPELEQLFWNTRKHPTWWRVATVRDDKEIAQIQAEEGHKLFICRTVIFYRLKQKIVAYSDLQSAGGIAMYESRTRAISRLLQKENVIDLDGNIIWSKE